MKPDFRSATGSKAAPGKSRRWRAWLALPLAGMAACWDPHPIVTPENILDVRALVPDTVAGFRSATIRLYASSADTFRVDTTFWQGRKLVRDSLGIYLLSHPHDYRLSIRAYDSLGLAYWRDVVEGGTVAREGLADTFRISLRPVPGQEPKTRPEKIKASGFDSLIIDSAIWLAAKSTSPVTRWQFSLKVDTGYQPLSPASVGDSVEFVGRDSVRFRFTWPHFTNQQGVYLRATDTLGRTVHTAIDFRVGPYFRTISRSNQTFSFPLNDTGWDGAQFRGQLWAVGRKGFFHSADGRDWDTLRPVLVDSLGREAGPLPLRWGMSLTAWRPMPADQDSLWMVGGLDSAGRARSTIFASGDGTHWVPRPPLAKGIGRDTFPALAWHGAVVHQGSLYIIGGCRDSASLLRQRCEKNLWKTRDGRNWTEVATNLDSSGDLIALEFRGLLWVFGGRGPHRPNDEADKTTHRSSLIWSTAVDSVWNSYTFPGYLPEGGPSERKLYQHCVAVVPNRDTSAGLWLFGGPENGYGWYSVNGVAWTKIAANFATGRTGARAFNLGGRPCVMGGISNDITRERKLETAHRGTPVWCTEDIP